MLKLVILCSKLFGCDLFAPFFLSFDCVTPGKAIKMSWDIKHVVNSNSQQFYFLSSEVEDEFVNGLDLRTTKKGMY